MARPGGLPEVDEYVDEIKRMIASRFPGLEFEVQRRGPDEVDLEVYGDLESSWDVLMVCSPRVEDILVETGIWIHVLPLGRPPA